MILFLDVVSPCPKFVLIENDNIIQSIHILDKNITKISDSLIPKYLMLERGKRFFNKINKLVVTTGPGSFTSLRVGISFMYGLSISNEVSICGISCIKLLNYSVKKSDFNKTLLLICSPNNQNFICIPFNKKQQNYQIHKINDDLLKKINLDNFTNCISNHDMSYDLVKRFPSVNKFTIQNVEKIINFNILSNLNTESVIKPIYISDNKLYN